jgi:hypothetical protein
MPPARIIPSWKHERPTTYARIAPLPRYGTRSESPPPTSPHRTCERHQSPTPLFPRLLHPLQHEDHQPRSNNTTSLHSARIQQVLDRSLAKRTMTNHKSAVRAFRNFCHDSGYTARPASEHTLCAFVAHLASTMAGSSIANIISGVHAWHDAINAVWNGSARLRRLLKGATNMAPAQSTNPPRPPVTLRMLELLHEALNNKNPEDCAILAAASTAFWAQLRLGEILGTSSTTFDQNSLPSRGDLGTAISRVGSRSLHLPRTKTNQTRGESVVITKQAHRVDPIAALNLHLHINQGLPAKSNLFAFRLPESGHTRILTRKRFLARCNTIWSRSGIPRTTGHSFRIGGTTALLQANVAPEIVKTMGRWSSDAFYSYWRDTQSITIQHAEQVPAPIRVATRSNASATDAHRRAALAGSRRSGARPHFLRPA